MNNEQFLIPFFNEMSLNNIRYCVLRNYEKLPKSLDGSDLDILIDKVDVNVFYEILNRVIIETNGKIIIRYGKLTPRICIAGHNSSSWYGIQLDVHEGILPYKTTNMFPIDYLLMRVNTHNTILVANNDDANLIAFLKEILHNRCCKEKYFEAAKETWTKNKFHYTDVLLSIYDNKFIEMLTVTLEGHYIKSNISELAKYGQSLLTQGIITKVNNLISKSSRFYRFIKTPGFSIAVLGTDGAGKTTIINAIRDPLNEAVHNSLYYEHMRPNLIPNIAQLFGKEQQSGPVTNPHSSDPSGFAGSLLRLFYYSFDYIIGYWMKVYPVKVKKSSIWIFDRYYYDYLIDPKRARINLPTWIIKGIKFFIPKPDLVLCLGTEPEVIHNRKPELPLDQVTEQVKKLKLFNENDSNSVWVDTGKTLDESVQKALEIIVNKMSLKIRK